MPEISIIVPVYNPRKEKLARCLNSIIEQTFTDYEVILVDDGSSDGSSEFCDEFCRMDDRFAVIHQQNNGVSHARNRGLTESCGRYICFIDCDDYVKREYLELLFILINKENADLAIGGVEIFTEKGQKLFSQQRNERFLVVNENDNSILTELLEKRYFNYVYAKLYLGDIIRNNNLRFNVEFSLGEDTLFVMEYLRYVNSIIISGQCIYIYIKYGTGTLTAAKCSDKYLKLMDVNRYIEETFIQKNWDNPLLLKKIDGRRFMCAEWAIESAEQKMAWLDEIAATKQVLNSTDLKNAINRSGKEILGIRMVLLYRIKSAVILLLHRKVKRMRQYYFKVMQRKIHSLAVRLRNI